MPWTEDVNYAVISLDAAQAQIILAMRQVYQTASSLSPDVKKVVLESPVKPVFYESELPSGLPQQLQDDILESLEQGGWVELGNLWKAPLVKVKNSIDEEATFAEKNEIEVGSDGVRFVGLCGYALHPILTEPLSWQIIQDVAVGINPWGKSSVPGLEIH